MIRTLSGLLLATLAIASVSTVDAREAVRVSPAAEQVDAAALPILFEGKLYQAHERELLQRMNVKFVLDDAAREEGVIRAFATTEEAEAYLGFQINVPAARETLSTASKQVSATSVTGYFFVNTNLSGSYGVTTAKGCYNMSSSLNNQISSFYLSAGPVSTTFYDASNCSSSASWLYVYCSGGCYANSMGSFDNKTSSLYITW